MAHSVITALTGVAIQLVYSDNSLGTGIVTVKSADTVAYTAPGDTEGAAVTLTLNYPAILTSNTAGRIQVKRTTSDDLTVADIAAVYYNGIAPTLELLQDAHSELAIAMKAERAGDGDSYVWRTKVKDIRAYIHELEAKYARETGQAPSVSYADFGSI